MCCTAALADSGWWRPQLSENLRWQLQLQGDLELIDSVDVYSVDSAASIASIQQAQRRGARVMCYISAGSAENWRDDFSRFPPQVIGNAYEGWPGEWWLDIRRLDLIAPVMRARIRACAEKGFDALDPDNINGYENNTGFRLTRSDAVRYIRWLAAEAHRQGMAFSLKNGEALIGSVADVIDMMQSESCVYYRNCGAVSAMVRLGKPVFAVEYQELTGAVNFSRACDVARKFNFSMILRTTDLRAGGLYKSCN